MSKIPLESLSAMTILTVPGLDGSGPEHWQTYWDYGLSNCHRVQMGDWGFPVRSAWVDKLDREIRRAPNPVLLAAHSLGCLAVAWWAKERWSLACEELVEGAFLVAPPDVERPNAPDRIRTFSPTPREPLPFPSLLMASRNDPYAKFETSRRIAQMWGSEFVDAGHAGHINADSGLGHWSEGLTLLGSLIRPRNRSEIPNPWRAFEGEESLGRPAEEDPSDRLRR